MNWTFLFNGYMFMVTVTAIITGMLILLDIDSLDVIDDAWDWIAYCLLWPFHVGKAIIKSIIYLIRD